jgi:hypothetical protein
MRTTLLVLTLSSALMPLAAHEARAQSGTPHGDICLAIDEARDTLSPQERASAIRLLSASFELAGRRVVADGCTVRYTLTHITLGSNIFVALSGADYLREGKASGLDDLPALYSQLVRSIITGRPMTGFNVVDRTNVTIAQTSVNRVHSERYGYARLGYGTIFAGRAYGAPSVGFGWRVELDSFGLDVSFLNMQAAENGDGSSGGASAGSLVKLQGLHFLKPTANASTYLGGGLSWGFATAATGAGYDTNTYTSGWHGSGLQGELTIGYECARASTVRIFVEGNGVLPLYRVRSETYSYSRPGVAATTVVAGHRYAPSLVVSVGIGWQRNRQ